MIQALFHLGKQFPKGFETEADRIMNEAGSPNQGAYFIGVCVVILSAVFLLSLVSCFYFQPLAMFLQQLAYSASATAMGAIFPVLALVFSLVAVLFSYTIITAYYVFLADARRNAVESVLPEFLAMVSSNVRGGMPVDQAIWNSAKPEFGILTVEVRMAIKESYSGKTLNEALSDLATRFNSKLFKRFIEILKQAISSGAEVGTVMEKLSDEIRDVIIIRKDIRSMLIVYVIFLFFAAAIGVPFLLSVSNKLIAVLFNAFALVTPTGGLDQSMASGSFVGNFFLGKPPITPSDFNYFSLIMIFITNFITAYIIGAAYTGNENDGIKFFPLMAIVAYVVFFGGSSLVDVLFQGFGI
jgi:archaellum biogenesis protein FlaJ (TadC family)